MFPPPPARLPHDIEQSSLCSTIGSLVIQIKISNEVNYYAIISGESKMVMSLIFESWLLFPYLGSATYSLYDFGHVTSFLSCGGLGWLNFPFLKVLVAQSCMAFFGPMDCSPSGFSVCGIFPDKNTGMGCRFLPYYISCSRKDRLEQYS